VISQLFIISIMDGEGLLIILASVVGFVLGLLGDEFRRTLFQKRKRREIAKILLPEMIESPVVRERYQILEKKIIYL
jgi:hypothetical protein